MSEKFYDEEIAPALRELAEKCGKHGMSMVCVVEYEKGRGSLTQFVQENAGLQVTMQALCARAGTNVDRYIIALARYAQRHGIDCRSSMVLSQFMPEKNGGEFEVKPQAE